MSRSLVIGGSGGLGRYIARHLADQGASVLVAGRDVTRARLTADQIGGDTHGLAVDLSRPDSVADALAEVGEVDHLVITAIHQARISVADFSVADAVAAATVKLVGYTEAVRVLRDRFTPTASVVLFGGAAKDRPYPGSTLVSATNGGVSSLARSLAVEMSPVRVNVLHPGVVTDSPVWQRADGTPAPARTLTGTAVTMADVADATTFLLRNPAANALDLYLDGGVRLMDRGATT